MLWLEIRKDRSAEWLHWRERPRVPSTDHMTCRMNANTEKEEQRQQRSYKNIKEPFIHNAL